MSQSSRWLSVLESLFVLLLFFFFHVSIEPVTSYSIRTSVTTTTTTTTSPATTQHTTPTLSSLSMTTITGPSSNSNNSNNSKNNNMKDRRSLLMSFVSVLALNMGGSVAVAAALPIETTLSPSTTTTSSSSNLPLESVYFGVGCFWHIQHEFVTAERDLLGRSDRELTSSTGYAGGLAADKMGRVCYHNLQGVADYGKLGHGEVVGMQLPTNKIVDFTSVYFSLYNPKTLGRYR
jgi:hypothetical protein